jgi:hypothetical protein
MSQIVGNPQRFEIISKEIVIKDGKEHFNVEIRKSSNITSLIFVFDPDNTTHCYLYSDLLSKFVYIRQERRYYKQYIDYIKKTIPEL